MKKIINDKTVILFLNDINGNRIALILKIQLGNALNVVISKELKDRYNLIDCLFKLYIPSRDGSQVECREIMLEQNAKNSVFIEKENFIFRLINNCSQNNLFSECLLEGERDINDKFSRILFGNDYTK